MKTKIRKYRDKDEEQVKRLISSVLTELFGESIIKEWENFKDYIVFYVAENMGEIVGTIALKDEGKGTRKLKRMYVLKEYRNKGLGQKLFDKVINFARKNNFRRILLSTGQKNKLASAYNFYIKNGFNEIRDVDWESDFKELKKEDVDITQVTFMERKL